MKRPLIAAAAGLALVAACGVADAASWSVAVQPGVFGRVAIGGDASAPLVYDARPVVALGNGRAVAYEPSYAPSAAREPVYLWVSDWQRAHWAEACYDYGACGVPVYFVQDGWYRDNVMRRGWTPEQRSWTQAQWLEQDRIARDRWERERWSGEFAGRPQPWARPQMQWQPPRPQPGLAHRPPVESGGHQGGWNGNGDRGREGQGGSWQTHPQGGNWQTRSQGGSQVSRAGGEPRLPDAQPGWQGNGRNSGQDDNGRDGHASGQFRGQYQHHPGESVDR